MNTPNNRRRRESKEKLERAFIDLLQSRELEQVSVSELCKRAGLNRTTFYANYADIYALADSIRVRLEDNLAELYREEIDTGYNSNDYLRLFRHIQNNQLFYRTYFKLGYDQYQILGADPSHSLGYDRALAREHFQDQFIEYHMEFFKSGLNRIIKLWLQNGCRESPEEMFGIIQSEYRGRTAFFRREGAENG